MNSRMNYHIDLHIHCKERSKCGKSYAEEQIRAAIFAGFNAIAFTDHKHLVPEEEIIRLNSKYTPFIIMQGIELSIDGEDLIVLGINDLSLETTKWNYPQLQQFVKNQKGFIFVAHPFRKHSITIPIDKYPPDAIEIASKNTPPSATKQIINIVKALNISILSNSDAHTAKNIGMYYNTLPFLPSNELEVINILRQPGISTAVIHEPNGTITKYTYPY